MSEIGIDNKAEILYIKLKMKEGQAFINFLKNKFKKTQLINQRFKILYEDENILFPIVNNQVLINKVTTLVDKNINFEVISREGILNEDYKDNTLKEFKEILKHIEKTLGKTALKNMHIHMAGINYTAKGERSERNLRNIS